MSPGRWAVRETVLAPIYVALPFALILFIWRNNLTAPGRFNDPGAHYLLFLVIVTWASDIAAVKKRFSSDEKRVAFFVDAETLLHGGDGLEDIRFAGPMPARAIDASEAIKLDLSLVCDRRIASPATA